MRSRIKITLVDKKGEGHCHRGHCIGDSFDYSKERGKLCPMAMQVGFLYIDVLRCGGNPPKAACGEIRFSCPDSDVLNIFKVEEEQIP